MDMYRFLQKHLGSSIFPLALPENEVHMRLVESGPLVCSLDDWLAAVLWDQLPSPREALQVLNQISVLSAYQGMDFVSLLACGYALAYRIRTHCGVSDAISNLFNYNMAFSDVTKLSSSERSRIEYRNMFSALVQARAIPSNKKPDDWSRICSRNDYTYKYLQEDRVRFWSEFQQRFAFVELRRRAEDGKYWTYWVHGQGDAWGEFLKKCLTFSESIAP